MLVTWQFTAASQVLDVVSGPCQPPHRYWEDRPASPTVVIRRHDQVCLYAKCPLMVPLGELLTVDCAVGRGPWPPLWCFMYGGSNIGRFTNDMGLLPGLWPWSACQTKSATLRLWVAGIEQIVKTLANAMEIFISYGIWGTYWLSCIASKVSEWGIANEVVQAVMWCATLEQSNWPSTLREQCLDDMRRSLAQL